MPNVYLSLKELKATGVAMGLNVESTAGDARLLGLLEAFSRQVDRWCNRNMFVTTGTKYFSGNGSTVLYVNDFISVTTLLEDDNRDGTFNIGWASDDYHVAPYNADPTALAGNPYNRIEVNLSSNGTQDVFQVGQRNYAIEAEWGYVSVTTSVSNLSGSHDATTTSIAFSGTVGALEVGWTVKVDNEQMFIRDESGTSVTVTRGVNGSTAATHASGTAISRYEYPEPVVMAVAIQAERVFKRSQGQFASDIGNPERGEIVTMRAGIDRDAKELLAPYRRVALGGL